MNLIAANLTRGKHLLQWGLLDVLLAAALLCPPLCVPISVLLSVIICPLSLTVGLWYALALMLVPFAGLLANAYSPTLAMCLLAFPMLSLLTNSLSQRRRASFNATLLIQIGAMLASMMLLCMYMISQVGYDLFTGTSKLLVEWFTTWPDVDGKLMSMLRAGVISLPTRFQNAGILMLSDIGIITDGSRVELLRILQLNLADKLRMLIPGLIMSISITVGSLSALLTARARVRLSSGSLIGAPSFQTLHLPRGYKGYMLALAVCALGLQLIEGSVSALMSALLWQALLAVYRLLGASVLTFLLCRRKPERTAWYYTLAALMYLLVPPLLVLLGVADSLLNIRVAAIKRQEGELK